MKDKELIKIITEFTKGILGDKSPTNMGFLVCWPLQGYLSFACEIETNLIEGKLLQDDIEHTQCWLELEDGRIIDPTASQYKSIVDKEMPFVYLGIKPKNYIG